MKIKVTSYNIFHCEDWLNEKIDYDAFARVIDSLGSDVTGLNEVRGKGFKKGYDEQAKILGEKIGCYNYFSQAILVEKRNPYGNAVLSRLPVRECITVPIPDPELKLFDEPYETRAILKMTTETVPELTFLITHFGLNEDEQKNAVETLLSVIPEKNCILMGDFNVRPDSEVLEPIRAKLRDTADTADCETLTFPADKPDKKIDYIFVSKNIKINSFAVEDVVLSDHRPVSAELEID